MVKRLRSCTVLVTVCEMSSPLHVHPGEPLKIAATGRSSRAVLLDIIDTIGEKAYHENVCIVEKFVHRSLAWYPSDDLVSRSSRTFSVCIVELQ